MHHVRQMTIGFLLLATIFGGVWSLRNSSDSVYSISKSSPNGTENSSSGDGAAVDEIAPDQQQGSGTGDLPGSTPSASPTPSVSPSPSASPSKASKPRAKSVPPAPKSKPKRPPAAKPKPATGDQAAKNRVITLVNAERAKANCGAVHNDTRLAAAAQGHSADMVARDYFDHTTPDGVDPWERARRQGYTTPTGENIAMGQRTADEVVKGWMDSPGHKANILNCDSRAIGMGMARNSGGQIYWTQMFGSV